MLKLNLTRIYNIFKKEIIFALRDSDILLTIILLPLLTYPFIAIVSATFLSQAKQIVDNAQVDVVLPEILREFEGYIATETIKVRFEADPGKFLDELKVGKIDALVEVATPSQNFRAADSSESLGLRILYDPTRWKSKKAEDVVWESILELKKDLMEKRLAQKKLDSDFLNSVQIVRKSVAKPAKMGGFLIGQLIPGLIIMFSLMGAFVSAIDLTAGERDRGTLETLLLSPVPLKEIMLGKLLAIIAIILIAVVVNLGCLTLMAKSFTSQLGQYVSDVIVIEASFSTIGLVFLAMIPFSAALASLFMTLAFISGSMKRAQTYLSPVLGIMLLPAFAGMVPGLDLTPLTAIIPVVNLALLFKALFVG
ncbi:MAG: ABC transporter permease subunit, partial [Candidatus Riflebacteria bacterium]|nr:ABC transporter permease subunit [Candidatus Riflebacteria bacterium]